ncbi:NUDIX hydrolase [Paenibacillus eucommiae]|uniref:NUDIX hydrolase n=1 Tax=Paenibacillus eucommiae TaxID=1355755 RepID=UPI0028AC7FD4|nr:NUDIX hydrolase [Paenibacillus eucommiae]
MDIASALIFDESSKKILMVLNKKGDSSQWSIPGGTVEAGETLEQAVKRETKEESGYDIEITGLYSVREALFSEKGHHALLFTFLANIVGGEMNISDPDGEVVEVKWLDLETANEFMTYLPDHLKIKTQENKTAVSYYYHGAV